nr:hypothetical protein [Bdellovibrionales bacterium]
MNLVLLLFIIAVSPSWAGKVIDEFVNVNPYTLPGDSERSHLPVAGIRFHDANDFFGNTDKLMTEVTSLNVMGIWMKHFATSIDYKGRFVQPILKTKYGEEELSPAIGIYAEWAEVMLNQSITLFRDDTWLALKLDAGIGYNDFGDHVFADLQRNVHSSVGSQDDSEKYGELQD